jgi:hypothetical protein
MKKLLTITFLIISTSCAVYAQHSDSWVSNDGPGHYEGKFTGMFGDAKYKIIPFKNDDKFVRYVINRNKGELILTIKSNSRIIVEKKIDKNLTDSLDISKFSNPISVYIKGNNASGDFTLDYPVQSK